MEGPSVAHGSDEQPAQGFRGHDGSGAQGCTEVLDGLVLVLVGIPKSSG